MARIIFVVALFELFSFSGFAAAGWFDSAVENAVERAGNRAVNEATDSAYDSTKEKIKNPGTNTRKAPSKGAPGQMEGSSATGKDVRIEEDEHYIMPDDYFFSEQAMSGRPWIYVHLGKLVTAPSKNTKGQAEFFQISDGKSIWTKNFWKTTVAAENEMKAGKLVIIFEGNSEEGIYQPPRKKEDARGHSWFMAKIVDLSDTYKGFVTVSGNYKVGLGNLRVVTK
jgi:hypothetical protein